MYQKRAIPAGMMIGLAGLLNLYLGGGVPGALAFGLGLLTVCVLQLDLFTGKMRPALEKKISIKELIIVFLGNFVGILIIGYLGTALSSNDTLIENAKSIMQARSNLPFGMVFIRAILCGICVQMAVDMYKKNQHPFVAMLPATAFVLLGCNHCIADMLYLLYGGSLQQIPQIFEVVFGNITGAVLFVATTTDSFQFGPLVNNGHLHCQENNKSNDDNAFQQDQDS